MGRKGTVNESTYSIIVSYIYNLIKLKRFYTV
jgi:hypothetical protein